MKTSFERVNHVGTDCDCCPKAGPEAVQSGQEKAEDVQSASPLDKASSGL